MNRAPVGEQRFQRFAPDGAVLPRRGSGSSAWWNIAAQATMR
jgi:hypothetical protein